MTAPDVARHDPWSGLCFEVWAPDPQPGDHGPTLRLVAGFAYFLEALDYRDGLDKRHIPCVVRTPIGAYSGTTLKNIYAQLDSDPRGEESGLGYGEEVAGEEDAIVT